MRARLTQVARGLPAVSTAVGRRALQIGRDPRADLRIENHRVSRRHARIHREGGRHVLTDLGSVNGTFLNGDPLPGPVALRDGDEIGLAGEVSLVYRVDASDRSPWLVVLAVLAGSALLAATGWLASELLQRRRAPVWVAAVDLAREGIAAERAGDSSTARARLKSAAGVLYKNGELDEFERARVMTVAMQRIGERLDEDLDLPALYERVLEASRPAGPGQPGGGGGCRLDRVDASQVEDCIEARVRALFAELRQPADGIPPYFFADVGRQLRLEREFIRRALRRGAPIIPELEAALVSNKMPPLLHYVALIESGYRTDAQSRQGAVGVWQLMRSTARQYGLEVSRFVDEREDVARSSDAAALYLRHLLFEFGSDALLLVLASYNHGQGQVREKLKRLDDPFSDRSYWALLENGLLPEETARYVTRFVAAAIAGEGGVPSREVLAAAGY